jgi:hypothetical protein
MRNLTAAKSQTLSRATLSLLVLAEVLFSSCLLGLPAKQKGASSMQERHAKCEFKAKRIVFENNAGGGVA